MRAIDRSPFVALPNNFCSVLIVMYEIYIPIFYFKISTRTTYSWMFTTVVERINVRNGLRLYTCIGMMDDKDVC